VRSPGFPAKLVRGIFEGGGPAPTGKKRSAKPRPGSYPPSADGFPPFPWRAQGDISTALLLLKGDGTSESGGSSPVNPSQPGAKGPETSPPGSTKPRAGGTTADKPNPESSPAFRELRELLDRGDYAGAVKRAYRNAFEGTVRAYGLTVPPSCTDRQFLSGFLRPDMGPLTTLLPQLYRLYEPVRFGTSEDGDRAAFRALLEKLYSETVLARLQDPGYQPSGPRSPNALAFESELSFRPFRKGGSSG